jgi:transcriptional regulator with XRE-family HTH domain
MPRGSLPGQVDGRGPQAAPRRRATTAKAQERAKATVGGNLRRLRRAKRLSLRGLAELSGLAVNTLSLIENNRTSPSVSTLQQLARALDTPIVSFFEDDSSQARIVHLKADFRARADFDHGTCEILSTGFNDHRIQPLLVTLLPGADSGPAAIVHTGLEFVYCLDGEMDYEIEGEVHHIQAGDSLLFEAHLAHRWRNPETRPTRVIMVLSPSDEHDHPSERHFTLERKLIRG